MCWVTSCDETAAKLLWQDSFDTFWNIHWKFDERLLHVADQTAACEQAVYLKVENIAEQFKYYANSLSSKGMDEGADATSSSLFIEPAGDVLWTCWQQLVGLA